MSRGLKMKVSGPGNSYAMWSSLAAYKHVRTDSIRLVALPINMCRLAICNKLKSEIIVAQPLTKDSGVDAPTNSQQLID